MQTERMVMAGVIALAMGASISAQSGNGVQINTDPDGENIVGDAANEPSFAISPVDPDVMVVGWRQFPTISSDNRYAGFAWTDDGGRTWMNGGTLTPPPGAPDAQQSDPVIAVDEFGSFFYNSLIFRSSRDGLTVYRSDDGGVTWTEAIYLIEGFRDKNWYETDRTNGIGTNNHYCCWTGGFMRSIDDAVTWEFVSSFPGFMSTVHVAPAGEVFVGWREWTDLFIRRSDNARDPGQTPIFSDARQLPFGNRPRSMPVNPAGAAGQVYIQTDEVDGQLIVYVLASSIPPGGVDVCDVLFSRSLDGGLTFSEPRRINDDPSNQDYQWMAAMSLSPRGRLDALWFDTRDDPNHRLSRLYYACSYDGGESWTPNRPVSDQFDSLVGFPVQRKIGDYFQCHSFNEATNVVYPSTFNGEQDIYFKRVHPISLEVSELFAGQRATVTATGARPNANTWLVGSLAGEGLIHIPVLDVHVRLINPRQIGDPRTTDENGAVQWSLPVPDGTQGRQVWLQVVQFANASQVEARTIQ